MARYLAVPCVIPGSRTRPVPKDTHQSRITSRRMRIRRSITEGRALRIVPLSGIEPASTVAPTGALPLSYRGLRVGPGQGSSANRGQRDERYTSSSSIVKLPHLCHDLGMTMDESTGYDREADEYTIEGACRFLGGISRATLDRWLPPNSPGRRTTRAPGQPRVLITGEVLRKMVTPDEHTDVLQERSGL